MLFLRTIDWFARRSNIARVLPAPDTACMNTQSSRGKSSRYLRRASAAPKSRNPWESTNNNRDSCSFRSGIDTPFKVEVLRDDIENRAWSIWSRDALISLHSLLCLNCATEIGSVGVPELGVGFVGNDRWFIGVKCKQAPLAQKSSQKQENRAGTTQSVHFVSKKLSMFHIWWLYRSIPRQTNKTNRSSIELLWHLWHLLFGYWIKKDSMCVVFQWDEEGGP